MSKIRIEKSSVQETLIVPLYGRKLAMDMYPDLFEDEWNGISDFGTAYLQALLFLLVMHWHDGIVIDKIWVGHSKLWVIKGTEDIPYVQTWKQVLKKRVFLSLVWTVGAAVVGGLLL